MTSGTEPSQGADAWNAFVVAATDDQLGYYPYYFIVRLHVFTPKKPSLDDCRRAPLGWKSGDEFKLDEEGDAVPGGRIVTKKDGGWNGCERRMLRNLEAEELGRVSIDSDRLRPVYNAPLSTLGAYRQPDLRQGGRYPSIDDTLFANYEGGLPEFRAVPADETLSDYLND